MGSAEEAGLGERGFVGTLRNPASSWAETQMGENGLGGVGPLWMRRSGPSELAAGKEIIGGWGLGWVEVRGSSSSVGVACFVVLLLIGWGGVGERGREVVVWFFFFLLLLFFSALFGSVLAIKTGSTPS